MLYLVLLAGAAWALWRYRAELRAALVRLIRALSELWLRLWGRKAASIDRDGEQAAPAKRLPRFADFANPFTTGHAGHWPPEELVRYSFTALEAWARDHGWPRHPDQTPHEFARQVGSHAASMAGEARSLAALYSQAAYAPGSLPTASVEHVERFWRQITAGRG